MWKPRRLRAAGSRSAARIWPGRWASKPADVGYRTRLDTRVSAATVNGSGDAKAILTPFDSEAIRVRRLCAVLFDEFHDSVRFTGGSRAWLWVRESQQVPAEINGCW